MKRISLLLMASVMLSSCQKERISLSSDKKTTIPNGVIAYYPFNGNTNDESQNGYNAINHGAKLAPDRFGNPNSAYYFDGDSSYVVCPSISKLDNTNTLSISLWVKTTGLNTNTDCSMGCSQFLLSRGDDTDNGHILLALSENPGNNIFAGAINSDFDTNPGIVTSKDVYPIPQDAWHYVVMTYDSQLLELYVDGVLESTTKYDVQLFPNGSPIYIGRNKDTYFTYFTSGYIDDVTIWNRALSLQEIVKNYYGK